MHKGWHAATDIRKCWLGTYLQMHVGFVAPLARRGRCLCETLWLCYSFPW